MELRFQEGMVPVRQEQTGGRYQGAGEGAPVSSPQMSGTGASPAPDEMLYPGEQTAAAPAPEDLKEVVAAWKTIVNAMTVRFRIVLASAGVQYNTAGDDSRLYVIFRDFLGETYIRDEGSRQLLEQVIAEKTGKKVEVKMMLQEDSFAGNAKLADISIEDRIRQQIHFDQIDIE